MFASGVDYGDVTAGRPAAFRARISRPTRRDLSVAVLTATGSPRWGTASLVQRAAADVRARFAEAARPVLPADQAAMLPALVLGDTSAVGEDVEDEFRAAGLTHLTAVSGANVTIVCGAVLLTAGLVGPRIAVGAGRGGTDRVRHRGAAVGQRAARRGDGRHRTVGGAVAAPPAGDSGAVGLRAGADGRRHPNSRSTSGSRCRCRRRPRWWSSRRCGRVDWSTVGGRKPLAAAVSVAAAAQLVTAPLVAGMSGTFSVVSVVANLAVAVVIPPITVIGTARGGAAALWPAAAELMIRFTGPELWWLLHVAHVGGGGARRVGDRCRRGGRAW